MLNLTTMDLVRFIIDAASAALMIGLLVHSRRYFKRREMEGFLFSFFLAVIISMAGLDIVRELLARPDFLIMPGDIYTAAGADLAWIIAKVILNIAVLLLSSAFFFLWLCYVNYRMYHSRDFLKRKFWIVVTPLIISTAVTVIDEILVLFTEKAAWLLLISLILHLAIRLLYFIISLVRLYEYKKQNGALQFFQIKAFFIPVLAGIALDYLTQLPFRIPGAAVGVFLLYLSMLKEWHYIDRETGLYSANYAEYIKDRVQKKRFEPNSAIIFSVGDKKLTEESAKTLKKLLSKGCEAIRMKEEVGGRDQVLVLCPVKERGPLMMVTEDVETALGLEGECIMKKKKETALEFVERVL